MIYDGSVTQIKKDVAAGKAPQLMLTDGGSKLVTPAASSDGSGPSTALALVQQAAKDKKALALRAPVMPKPTWHPKWKLMRVISGHLGWVRSIAVEPGNQWYVTPKTVFCSLPLRAQLPPQAPSIAAARTNCHSWHQVSFLNCTQERFTATVEQKISELDTMGRVKHPMLATRLIARCGSIAFPAACARLANRFATGAADRVIKIWDLASGGVLWSENWHPYPARFILPQLISDFGAANSDDG